MVLPVLAAFENVKTDLAPVGGPKIYARESFGRTGLYADMAFPAGLIQWLPRFKRGIG